MSDCKIVVDLGRVIGGTDVVPVAKGDLVVYGVRRNREVDGLVPFVKNRERAPSTTVAMHLVRRGASYELSSAWVGVLDDESFPLAPDATATSVDFWDKHAFIYGSQEIIAGTETPIWPWPESRD